MRRQEFAGIRYCAARIGGTRPQSFIGTVRFPALLGSSLGKTGRRSRVPVHPPLGFAVQTLPLLAVRVEIVGAEPGLEVSLQRWPVRIED